MISRSEKQKTEFIMYWCAKLIIYMNICNIYTPQNKFSNICWSDFGSRYCSEISNAPYTQSTWWSNLVTQAMHTRPCQNRCMWFVFSVPMHQIPYERGYAWNQKKITSNDWCFYIWLGKHGSWCREVTLYIANTKRQFSHLCSLSLIM